MATHSRTLSDLIIPRSQRIPALNAMREAGLILGGSLFVAALAQLQIPLQPVPVTGQTFGVLLIGALLGWKRGGIALLAYLAEGFAGFPVFAGASSGFVKILGPTGGYLAAFVLAAMLVGFLAERGWDRNPAMTAIAMLLGSVVIDVVGSAWLGLAFLHHNWPLAYQLGVQPFIVGDLLKVLAAALLLPAAHWLVGAGRKK